MKRLLYSFFLLSAFVQLSVAATGDTIRVPVMDKYLWTWNGFQDRWVVCPPATKTFEKIILRYTLTCPQGGCGEWDYTTGIIYRQHTGITDSTLRDAADFTVDGTIYDSIRLSPDTTWSTSYNATTHKTDTTANTPYRIYFFGNANEPFTPTDSGYSWRSDYWNYLYDNTGAKVDSFFVNAGLVVYGHRKQAYFKFERIIPYELTRYITPYGKAFPKDWTRTWEMDITEFSSLLHDSVELRSFYDGWSQGSLYSLELVFIEGTPSRTTYKVEQIYNGYFPYGNKDNSIENYLVPKRIFRDQNADLVTFRLTVSGHGSDPNGACEFIDATHSIAINGEKRYDQHLWRDDCGINPTWPQTGTYWFPRAGWCPGDLVYPFDYDVTAFSQKGDSIVLDYNMEPYTSSSPTGGYNVHGLVFYSSGPNFTTDVAVVDIKQPTSDFRYARTNPICSDMQPIVTIQNQGKTPLTSCKIGYWVDDRGQNEFNWSGTLNYLEKADVALPRIDLIDGSEHTFNVRVFNPNGTQDEHESNDAYTTKYTAAKNYSNRITMTLRTDKHPDNSGYTNDIRWELIDAGSGAKIEEGSGYDDGQLVRDTFFLERGCYRFTIYDESLIGEGLMPWVVQGTNGSLSLRDDKNATVVSLTSSNYTAEFGSKHGTTFTVGDPSEVAETHKLPAAIAVYPNPASTSLTVDLKAFGEDNVTVTVYDLLGKAVLSAQLSINSGALDVSTLPAGTYILRAESASMKASAQVVIE